MSKKPWTDTFGTIGVKFRSKKVPPGGKIGILDHLVAAPKNQWQVRATKTWDWFLEMWLNGTKFEFSYLESFFGPELDESGLESFLQGTFTNFGRPMAEHCDSVFLTKVRPNVPKTEFFYMERLGETVSTPTFDESGLESFPPGTFTNFGRPTARNCDSVFLTGVRQKPGIGFWRCHQMVQNSIFFPLRDFFAPEHDKCI